MGGFFSEIIGRILGRVAVTGVFLGGAHQVATGGPAVGMVQGVLGQTPAGAHAAATPPATAGLSSFLGGGKTAAAPAFFEVKARITAVARECRLVNNNNGRVTRTEALPCERAQQLLKRPDFEDHLLSDQMRISYIYYAPDGNGVHEGSAQRRPQEAALLNVGDVLDIKVDSNNPTKSTVL